MTFVSKMRLGDLSLVGQSRAGDQTWFRVDPPGLGFDVGRGTQRLAGARDLFLTHGHLDHSLGLPFVLSQRRLQGLGPATVYVPETTAAALEAMVEAAARLEGDAFEYDVRELTVGDRVRVGRDLTVEAFETDHGVPSLGYHLLRSVRRLKEELRGLEAQEIVRLKATGREVEESSEELWLSYCGDTGPRVFDLEPRILGARILLLECTFLPTAQRQRSAELGHLHLEDLVERQADFANEALILHHLSHRYSLGQLAAAVGDRLPDLAGRVHLFGSDLRGEEQVT